MSFSISKNILFVFATTALCFLGVASRFYQGTAFSAGVGTCSVSVIPTYMEENTVQRFIFDAQFNPPLECLNCSGSVTYEVVDYSVGPGSLLIVQQPVTGSVQKDLILDSTGATGGIHTLSVTPTGSSEGDAQNYTCNDIEVEVFVAEETGTITADSLNSITGQPLSGSWYFPAGPSNPCSGGLSECSGLSQTYLNQPSGQYTVSAPFIGESSPPGYIFNSVISTCGSAGSTATCQLMPGSTVGFSVYWDPLAAISPSKLSSDLTVAQGGFVSDTVVISNIGTPNSFLKWSATASAPWLSARSCSGTCFIGAGASTSTTITINASALAPGSYTGTITWNGISEPGSHDLSPQTFTVNLTVTPSLSCAFNGNPLLIAIGEKSTLDWSCNNATACSISPAIGSVSPSSGQRDVSPTSTTIYTLACSNAWTNTQRIVEISVATSTIIEVPP